MANVTLTVSFVNQSVEVSPEIVAVEKGLHALTWTRADPGNPNWQLFGLIIEADPNPFRDKTVTPQVMSIIDDNPGGAQVTFNYRVEVKDLTDGSMHTFDPQIVNGSGG